MAKSINNNTFDLINTQCYTTAQPYICLQMTIVNEMDIWYVIKHSHFQLSMRGSCVCHTRQHLTNLPLIDKYSHGVLNCNSPIPLEPILVIFFPLLSYTCIQWL